MGCAESVQQIEWPCRPRSVHGQIPPVLRKWEELHQLGLMVGTPSKLKRVVANRDLKGSIVVVLNIWETLIPGAWMFRILHP